MEKTIKNDTETASAMCGISNIKTQLLKWNRLLYAKHFNDDGWMETTF